MSAVLGNGTYTVRVTFKNQSWSTLGSSVFVCICTTHCNKLQRQLIGCFSSYTIDPYMNTLRQSEWTLVLAGSGTRKFKTYTKHGFKYCHGFRVWSTGTNCNSRLSLMTLTELIHTKNTHTILQHPLPVGCGEECHIFWPFPSFTSHPAWSTPWTSCI